MDGTNNFHLFGCAMTPYFTEGGERKTERGREGENRLFLVSLKIMKN